MKYLKETAHDALTACALDILRSVRAMTRVAKASSTKIDVKLASGMTFSFTAASSKKTPCLRVGKMRYYKKPNERIVYTSLLKTAKVYTWIYDRGNGKTTVYYIVADSAGGAKAKAKELLKKRVDMYRGLARRALSILMKKTFLSGKDGGEATSPKIEKVAFGVTTKQESAGGGIHRMRLHDGLDYAVAAVKGGQAGIDMSMMKAMNKIVSIINFKCRDLLDFKPLATPFPEIRKR